MEWYKDEYNNVREKDTDFVICQVVDGGHPDDSVVLFSPEEQEEHAALIIQAPTLKHQRDELLEVCKSMLSSSGMSEEKAIGIRVAIKSVEGGGGDEGRT